MKPKLLVIATLVLTTFSCEKTLDQPNQPVSLSEISKTNQIKKLNGVLIFPDNLFVTNTIASLESDLSSWWALFDSNYGNLTEIEIENYIESTNYDENKPLTDFENSYTFVSLRSKINTDEKNWLLNTNGDIIANDPDNHFVPEEVNRAFLNIYCELGIGTSLYKFVKDGYYEITDGNFSTLQSLRSTPINITGLSNVVFYADGAM